MEVDSPRSPLCASTPKPEEQEQAKNPFHHALEALVEQPAAEAEEPPMLPALPEPETADLLALPEPAPALPEPTSALPEPAPTPPEPTPTPPEPTPLISATPEQIREVIERSKVNSKAAYCSP